MFRGMIDWLKRLIIESAAGELRAELSSATGYDVPEPPLMIDVESKPAITAKKPKKKKGG